MNACHIHRQTQLTAITLAHALRVNDSTDVAAPTDVTAEQTGPNTVLVTWTPPPVPPAAGYQVQVTVGTTTSTTNVTGTSHTIPVNNQFGVYSIQVKSLSAQHLPSEATAPVQVTMRGRDWLLAIFRIHLA